MSPEEQQAASAAAAVARHQSDQDFLRSVGIALEAEAARRRDAGEDALDKTSAGAFVSSLI